VCPNGLAHDGGVVLFHGGVDGKSCKINAFMEDGGYDFGSVCMGTLRACWTKYDSTIDGQLVEAFGFR
jgi:hypothetical protein